MREDEAKDLLIVEDNKGVLPSELSSKNAYVEPYIVWENGVPVQKHKVVITKQDIQSMKYHAAVQMYHGEWDPVNECYIPDKRYEGLSKIEVAQHRLMDKAASGDTAALFQIENRMLGMPKQQVESLNINATLEGFLEKVAQGEGLASETEYPPSVSNLLEDNSSSLSSNRLSELDI